MILCDTMTFTYSRKKHNYCENDHIKYRNHIFSKQYKKVVIMDPIIYYYRFFCSFIANVLLSLGFFYTFSYKILRTNTKKKRRQQSHTT